MNGFGEIMTWGFLLIYFIRFCGELDLPEAGRAAG